MIKSKIKLALILSTLFLHSQFPSFAMNIDDEEYNRALNTIANRNNTNINLIRSLEQENQRLTTINSNLNNAIIETDNLVTGLLNSSVTAFSYLSAVAKRTENKELSRLFIEATNDIQIPNIITGGHTKFKETAPESHIKLLEVTKLLEHTRISEDYSTIRYSTLLIRATPQKDLINQSNSVTRSINRQETNLQQHEMTTNNFTNPTKRNIFPSLNDSIETNNNIINVNTTRQEELNNNISEIEDIRASILDNVQEFGIDPNPKKNENK
jgi:hypothetical protein